MRSLRRRKILRRPLVHPRTCASAASNFLSSMTIVIAGPSASSTTAGAFLAEALPGDFALSGTATIGFSASFFSTGLDATLRGMVFSKGTGGGTIAGRGVRKSRVQPRKQTASEIALACEFEREAPGTPLTLADTCRKLPSAPLSRALSQPTRHPGRRGAAGAFSSGPCRSPWAQWARQLVSERGGCDVVRTRSGRDFRY